MADFSEVKEVFLDFLHMGEVFLSSGYNIPPEFIVSRASYEAYCREQEEYKIRRAKYELKKQKLMRVRKKGEEVIFELTRKGITEGIKQEILNTKKRLPASECCLVVFDIPENVKSTRHVFRSFLKRAGFKQVQLSVWKSKLDIVSLLSNLIEKLEIKKWVVVYRAKTI